MATNFKLGTHEPGVGLRAYRHAGVCEREIGDAGPYLSIAPADGHCEWLVRLADELSGPFRVVYDLLSQTEGYPEGRYELADPLTAAELGELIVDIGEFLEHDARHDLALETLDWPSGSGRAGQLVYDQHNIILAYGPLDRFETIAIAGGLTPGRPELPIPHSHHIYPEYDGELIRLLRSRVWIYRGTSQGEQN